MKNIERNLTMLCDFYEITMGNGYFKSGIGDRIVYSMLITAITPITAAMPSPQGLSR